MTEKKDRKLIQTNSTLVGAQTKAVTLDKTIKLDIDTDKTLVDNIIDAGITGGLNTSALEEFTSISNSRDQIYQLIDTMVNDSSVAAIVRTYAEDVCETADNGHIVWCESDDPKISKFVNYLLNVMNVDKNIFGWTYSLIKYGDVYLRLYRESDYADPLFNREKVEQAYSARNVLNESAKKQLAEKVNLNVHKTNDPYSYYIEMVADPGTMFELTKYGKTYGYVEIPNEELGMNYLSNYASGQSQAINNYKMKSNDVHVYQADDFVHACLDDNFTRYPETVQLFINEEDFKSDKGSHSYSVRRGKSLLYDSYKIWREKSLLENAALLHRITRSSLVRNIQVEVGDMPKSQVQNTLRRIKELFEQKSALNTGVGMSEYNNPGPIENNIFTATHNGQGAITVDSVGGDVEVKNLADLDWWNNKFYSSYGIPKQYFGWTDDGAGFNGGTSLTILSSVYSKGVKRVQNAMLQAITDAINLFLINRGCRSYLNNFVLKMKAPLSQEEKDYREDLGSRVTAISNLQSLFSDVESKSRRLEILKTLIGTLNYGDAIMQELDQEIAAAKAVEEEAAKQAAEEAKAAALEAQQTSMNEPRQPRHNTGQERTKNAASNNNDVDLDLGMSSVATAEEFSSNGGSQTLTEGPDFLAEDNDLPTPEQANKSIDFTKNK